MLTDAASSLLASASLTFEESVIAAFGFLKPLPETSFVLDCDGRLDAFRKTGLNTNAIVAWLNHRDPIFRRNRIQLLDSFVILVPCLATPDIRHAGGLDLIAAIVDRGNPLVESIAEIVGVDRPTIRFLMTCHVADVGRVWIERPMQLFWAVSIAPRECRPRAIADWLQFRTYWQLSGLSDDPNYGVPIAMDYPRSFIKEHVFSQLCRNGYSRSAIARLDRMTRGRPDNILHVRDYFEFVSTWCEHRFPAGASELAPLAGPGLGESFLMRYPLAELVRQSMDWHLDVTSRNHGCEDNDPMRSDSPLGSWPALLQEPFFSCGLHAISLTCAKDLVHEGSVLRHCVGSFVESCGTGDSHIVSIRDDQGNSLSTAEIGLLPVGQRRWEPHVTQHYGFDNTYPRAECVLVLDELVRQLSDDRSQGWLSRIQAIHEERREEIELHLNAMRVGNRDFEDSVLRQVLPDFDMALSWLRDTAAT